MKKLMYLASLVLAMATVTSCDPNTPKPNNETKGIHVFDQTKADSYYSYAEISVPAGLTTVYLENYSGVDEQGHKVNLTVTPVQVKPIVAEPKNGRDVEPFGTVKFLFKAPIKTMVAIYYEAGDNLPAAVAARRLAAQEEDTVIEHIYTLNDYLVDQVISGEFGKTRYVQMPYDFAFFNDGDNAGERRYPDDVVMYDAEHNHTLRYTFAYENTGFGNGYGYVLTDAYYVENHVVTGRKYNYCGGCEDCNLCMPWGCSCGCGSTNTAFVPSGDTTDGQPAAAPVLVPTDVNVLALPEPAPYLTEDQGQTFYHSSGVVMFEDSWPTVNQGGVYDTDFDDVVIDYDIEAKTVSDELLADEGWREQVKVVLHLRAVGSGYPYRVGVRLEGFDQQYVESIEQHFSLDSWQNPHGNLPEFSVETLQKNSGHYENDPLNPIVEIAHIHTMNQERAGKGAAAEYTYENNGFVNHTVFNLTYGYKGTEPNRDQYSPELETMTLPYPLSKIQQQKYYNVIPGFINVAGGLFTYTVIYHMLPRAEMTPEERVAAKQNMIDAVVNTTKQNFYIIADGNFTPVGLKGYDPVFLHPKSESAYNKKYQQGLAAGNLDPNVPYSGTNGAVWGFKCPTLTRHIWNKLYFSQAYPHYEEWITSGGTQYPDWYVRDIDERFVVCWW